MIEFKTLPNHDYSVFVELSKNISPILFEKEIEVEINGKLCAIQIEDYFDETIERIALLGFLIKFAYGITADQFRTVLYKKYKNLQPSTHIAIVLYKLIEIA